MNEHPDELGAIARHWIGVIRDCGDDVSELLHDGHRTACVAGAAFAYVNVGCFGGAELVDPVNLLEGTEKYMRHVKLSAEQDRLRFAGTGSDRLEGANCNSTILAEMLCIL